ncbi:glucose-6-phosphate 1-epimerase-like protein, partial [Trifolium pratense]
MSRETVYVKQCKGVNGLEKIIQIVDSLLRCIYMEGKLHPGKMNLEKNCYLNKLWTVDPNPPPFPTNSKSRAFVDLLLKNSEDDSKNWPHRYEFHLRIALGPTGDLMLTSRIRNTNTDGKSFTFTFAYHTYLYVTDISEVRIEGLETLDYLDNLKNRERYTEQGDAITFESEV